MTTRELNDYVGKSPLTVRLYVRKLRLKPTIVGQSKTWTKQQAARVKAAADAGGRWPKERVPACIR